MDWNLSTDGMIRNSLLNTHVDNMPHGQRNQAFNNNQQSYVGEAYAWLDFDFIRTNFKTKDMLYEYVGTTCQRFLPDKDRITFRHLMDCLVGITQTIAAADVKAIGKLPLE